MSPVKKKSTGKVEPKTKALNAELALPDFARYFFMAAILGVGLMFFWVISPFFDTLIFASLVAIIFYPIQKFLMIKMKGRRTLPALITTMSVFFILLAPLILLSIYVAQEAIESFSILESFLSNYDFDGLKEFSDVPYLGAWLDSLSQEYGFQELLSSYEFDVIASLSDLAEGATTFIVNEAGNIFKGISDWMVQLFIFFITVYYFFRDGDKVTAYLKKISPLPEQYENEIELKLRDSTYAVVVGNFGTAVIQGLAGGIGFAIVGIEHVVLWATFMAFASLIPYVGATIIWLPVAVSLFFAGELWWAGFLGIWGMLVVASVDNVVRPFLIGGSAKMHSLATFLVVLGGILIFGLKGIVYGPLILSITITVIHIYEKEYKHILDT